MAASLVGALIFVLRLVATAQGALPGLLVALELGALPGPRVGLALVIALLVLDNLRPFAAAGQTGGEERGQQHDRLVVDIHFFASWPAAACACTDGAP